MSVFTNIQTALDTRLNSISGSPAIAWPNTSYKPTQGTLFLRPSMLPSDTDLFTLAGMDTHAGIYQIDVFVPAEKGTATLNTWLDAIHDHFAGDLDLVSGSNTVYIQQISRGLARRDESWYTSFVEVHYLCYN